MFELFFLFGQQFAKLLEINVTELMFSFDDAVCLVDEGSVALSELELDDFDFLLELIVESSLF
jgi:hypothetical protein